LNKKYITTRTNINIIAIENSIPKGRVINKKTRVITKNKIRKTGKRTIIAKLEGTPENINKRKIVIQMRKI